MFPSYMLQGGSSSLLQGGGSGGSIQGSSPTIQGSSPNLQPTVNPQNGQNLSLGGGAAPQGLVNTAPAVDPAAVAAAQAAAAQAAKVRSLRGEAVSYTHLTLPTSDLV